MLWHSVATNIAKIGTLARAKFGEEGHQVSREHKKVHKRNLKQETHLKERETLLSCVVPFQISNGPRDKFWASKSDHVTLMEAN
jgi:hypothetical protein